ncbi:type IV secretion protein Rhs [Xanthomonas euvesicatoria pv. euvesicatoria]|uniref:RHS repeat protein n=4 Tax=Xanthomonas euvesicatoria TaxID=456327 RepID=A0A6B3KQ35_XANEU|nr:RHS repeat domain-containing protein [Xanthomonas euvesicatoria]AOY68897.1 type IV secretion protein Rhs [Xanthomonas euvesicatoria pv. vesicatoria str. 85-10]APO91319.1 type IV secretion protein Rhs [Xanthomonas euvesicatoria]KHL59177.1 type IV secretion protein Rhs [Xanthomonas euvesicatoria]KHL64613.1 type IV secretion protein Rhs [Xanthomonas euvesicatoria]KLA52514.1 type IV secretion protein Rhs [Xanthomonas euvesicatoria]
MEDAMESGRTSRQIRVFGLALAALVGLSPALGAAEDVYDDYGKLIQSGAVVKSPGDKLFGDNINLYTGSMEIVQTDVDLKGNNALQVRVGRRFTVGSPTKGHFKLWDLDIPYMHGVFGFPGGNIAPDGWVVNGTRDTAYSRCSRYEVPPAFENQGGYFDPSEFWRGSFLYRPGSGDQELLQTSSQALRPNDGRTYPIVLKDGSAVRCLASLDGASESGARGEGFELVDTQGSVYAFNHMVSRWYPPLSKSSPVPQANSVGTASAGGASMTTAGIGNIVPMVANNYILVRKEVLIYPARVTDRFGNAVTYNWNPGAPWQLLSIVASDGRRIDLSYAGGDGNTITSVTTGGRTWSYGYSDTVDMVTLPDGSSWTFDLLALSRARVTYGQPPGCDNIRPWSRTNVVGSITAPTGARSDYTVNSMLMGRSWVPRLCNIQEAYSEIPYQFYVMAVTSRRISGSGLPAQGLTWTYDYGTPNNCWQPSPYPNPSDPAKYVECNAGSPITRDITVKDPAGQATRYRFGNRYWSNEGLLLQQDFGWNGSTAKRTKMSDYAAFDAAPYAARTMYPAGSYGDNTVAARQRPVRQVITIDNGDQFVWRIADCNGQPCFDEFARPTRTERFSPWHSRTDETTYYDERGAWVLGQTAMARNVNTGIATSQIDYGANALPQTEWRNGKLVATYTYNPDGTLAQVKDGLGNATTLSGWKRGIPQTLTNADGTAKSASVDDNGWIRQTTDENGFATTYGYDAMGRLNATNYPSGDSTAWNSTAQAFERVGSDEYGIGAGHWRQTVTTGNAQKITYFDALWQPLLTREYDAANLAGTLRAKRFAYDHEGRVVFASYPSSTEAASTGIWTEFDVVGRPTTISQDSEQGLLTTITQYLPGAQTLVTNPRGAQTRTGYQVFDQPVYDAPVWVQLPESARTSITRDVFGKAITIERGAQ